MKRKIIIGIGIVVVVFIVLAGIKAAQIAALLKFAKSYAPPPETVATAEVHPEEWRDTLTAVGSISAVQGVTLAPELGGTVSEIHFESGALVKKGDLLLKLDVSSEEAQLRALEAQVELARLNAERRRLLRASNTVSQAELDQAEADLKQAQANADVARATIDKKTIRAPFNGKLGIRMVNLGETIDARKPIVSLQSLAPVYCDFSLPQQDLSQLKPGQAVRVVSDTFPGQTFTGTLTAANPDVATVTRSLTLQATLANTNQLLRPGMFVRVTVELDTVQKVLAIPATAVLSAPYGDSVYVIEAAKDSTNLVARQQFVRTGPAHGDFVSVLDGLKPGEKVASAGIFKLRNGASVTVNNEAVPKPSKTPNPSDS